MINDVMENTLRGQLTKRWGTDAKACEAQSPVHGEGEGKNASSRNANENGSRTC